MTNQKLAKLWREYVNDFISVEGFANHHGFTLEQAFDIIDRGRTAHHDRIPLEKSTHFLSVVERETPRQVSALDTGRRSP